MLEIIQISKAYKKNLALHDISLTLTNGIYALLGPNGAGKSTLMNIICGLLHPDEGHVLWNHEDIYKHHQTFVRHLGYAPQQQGLYEDFSGRRFLSYMALLKDIPKADIANEVQRVAHSIHMIEHLDKKCKTYSGGMKQRILVAQALLGSPSLLLFDEPTAGLDPKERVALRQVFEELAMNHILIIATHVVSDIEGIAKEVIFLKKGKLIAHDQINTLLKSYDVDNLEDCYLQEFQETTVL